jgi:hypothetical protein
LVFQHTNGDRICKGACSMHGDWPRNAAGIIGAAYIHDLRRKMAKELIDAGVSELDAMTVTEHQNLSTFRSYAIRYRQAQERALGQLAGHRPAPDAVVVPVTCES